MQRVEKLVEDISFSASERSGEAVTITAGDVRTRVGELAKNADLTRFIYKSSFALSSRLLPRIPPRTAKERRPEKAHP